MRSEGGEFDVDEGWDVRFSEGVDLDRHLGGKFVDYGLAWEMASNEQCLASNSWFYV